MMSPFDSARRYLSACICVAIVFIATHRTIAKGIESDNIVGYMETEIRKGWTRIVISVTDLDGKRYCLNEFLKSNAARAGDLVCYHTVSQTNINILLKAQVKQTDQGLHFYDVDSGTCRDDYPLLPTWEDAKVIIRYFRETDEVTPFSIAGQVPGILLEPSKSITDLPSLANWIRNRICYEVYNNSLDKVMTFMTGKGDLPTDHSFANELLEYARKEGPIYFYAFFKGEEATPTRIYFNPIKGEFMDENGVGRELDTSNVRKFGSVEDEFALHKIDKARRLPADIVEDMNRLLKAHFFDDKKLFWLVKRDGSSRLVTYDDVSKFVIDCNTGARYNLDRDDIVGFSDVPNPKDRNVAPPPILGKGRYLSRDEVKELEKVVLPSHHNFGKWLWLIGQIIQCCVTFFIGRIIPPGLSKAKRILTICFYFILPIGFIRPLWQRLIAKRAS